MAGKKKKFRLYLELGDVSEVYKRILQNIYILQKIVDY